MITIGDFNAPWEYYIGTKGRFINVRGKFFAVRAYSLRDAIKQTRKQASKAWSLYIYKPAKRL